MAAGSSANGRRARRHEAELDFDVDSEVPLRVCHLGQAAGASLVAFVLGGIATLVSGREQLGALGAAGGAAGGSAGVALLCAGTQGMVQLVAQAFGAATGALAMAGVNPNKILDEGFGEGFSPTDGDRPTPMEPGGPWKHFAMRLAGASVGAALAWVAFPPGLDFSLVASSLLAAVGAVGAALASESLPERGPAVAGGSGAGLQGRDPGDGAGVKVAALHRAPIVAAAPVGRPFGGTGP
mmetsp:Transcript_24023/g.54201  ORF Transcript_24023/g.54201 Transcript_24023/m.54201 type:complete len:239 (-) Transcript_24023:40-756(-)